MTKSGKPLLSSSVVNEIGAQGADLTYLGSGLQVPNEVKSQYPGRDPRSKAPATKNDFTHKVTS